MAEPITGKFSFDAAAREQQVVANGPRYAPLRVEELSPEGQEQLDVIRKAFNIPESRPLPDVSLIQLRHTGMFRGQMALGVEMAARGTIPGRDRELVTLRVAVLTGSPFEWSEHVDISKAFDVTAEDIERIIDGSDAPGWTDHEAALLLATEELLADYCMSEATWSALSTTYTEMQMLELLLLVGSYVMTAMQLNTLKVQPKGGFDYRR